MPPHPLTNFEMQKNYQNEPKFDGAYSRNNVPKIKDGAYVIGTHWIVLYVNGNNVIHLTTAFCWFGHNYWRNP